MVSDIPTEGRIPFLDIMIPLHWQNHAILMFIVWFVMVPFAVMFLRFGKIAPSTWGIPRASPQWASPGPAWRSRPPTSR